MGFFFSKTDEAYSADAGIKEFHQPFVVNIRKLAANGKKLNKIKIKFQYSKLIYIIWIEIRLRLIE
jgi:hypothetical protein